ncbi:hypothetical protein CXB51_002960 [Gossypium anomalum]|uniref:Uncharacterized protein n=1 Tax=Gossypium anomalum TaxID=47600 RepID=A0A8J5ZZW9_9ROSI|nr:hypothetical protein CXB51_002960 [Gossypium anomalum]
MDVVRRPRYHILHPAGSVSKPIYVGCECVIGSVRDGGNARIGLVVVIIRVEAMDSIATARHERVAQGGYAEEERRELAANIDYMTWFKVVGKSYLLSPEVRSRQVRSKKQRRPPQQ